MQRSVKLSLVEKLNSRYLEPNLWVFVINYAGIRANDIRLLRVDLKANSVASMQVVKNRLNKVAMKGTPFEALAGGLSGQLAVVRTKDGISVARILRQYADSKKIDIVAYSDGCGVYGEDYLRELAQISSLDALRARLLSSLLVPVHSLLNIMRGVPSSLLGVMDQRSKQIQQ